MSINIRALSIPKDSKDLFGWINDVNSFASQNVPVYILSFLNKIDFEQTMIGYDELYPLLLKHLPEGVPAPSFNQLVYFKSICHLQQRANRYMAGINHCDAELDKLSSKDNLNSIDQSQIRSLNKTKLSLDRHYLEIYKLLMKYSNDGLNRESRDKNIDKVTQLGLSDIHRIVVN